MGVSSSGCHSDDLFGVVLSGSAQELWGKYGKMMIPNLASIFLMGRNY